MGSRDSLRGESEFGAPIAWLRLRGVFEDEDEEEDEPEGEGLLAPSLLTCRA
jgi:hypothetical protein